MSPTLWEKLRIFSLSKKNTILIKKECISSGLTDYTFVESTLLVAWVKEIGLTWIITDSQYECFIPAMSSIFWSLIRTGLSYSHVHIPYMRLSCWIPSWYSILGFRAPTCSRQNLIKTTQWRFNKTVRNEPYLLWICSTWPQGNNYFFRGYSWFQTILTKNNNKNSCREQNVSWMMNMFF